MRWPKVPAEEREARPLETALRVWDIINPRYRIAVVVALGSGLRQGEAFGLSPHDVDFERGVVRARRQVQLLSGRLYFALPKGGKTRMVGMPPSVVDGLASHFLEYPAAKVELLWGGPEPEREKQAFPLLLTIPHGNALRSDDFNDHAWKPALAKAGVIPTREPGQRWNASRKDGFHVLRHTYASIILEAGESVVTLARWLGHSSPTSTLGDGRSGSSASVRPRRGVEPQAGQSAVHSTGSRILPRAPGRRISTSSPASDLDRFGIVNCP